MAENYLITGYWGEPHVTSENDRGINAAIFGAGRFVLPVGEQFRAEYIGNNTVRIYDGKLIDNGAVAGIPAGEYVDLLIPEAGQGMKRNDLIAFQYSQDAATLVESGSFVVVTGAETSGTAVDPELTHGDLLSNKATFDQMALWRVPVSGTVISTPEILYNTKFAGERVVTAHSEDGANYTVNLPGVAKLYTGLEFTIVPDKTSATTAPKLNINGLGAVSIRRRITSSTSITVPMDSESYIVEEQPMKVFYNGKYWIADMAKPNAPDLYGTTAMENGGTGAQNLKDARANLHIVTSAWNLLDNSDFRNPVNQGGASIYSDVKDKITIDRWKTSGKVQASNGWLAFTNNRETGEQILRQLVYPGVIANGKTYTAAMMLVDGTLCVGSGVAENEVFSLVFDSEDYCLQFAAMDNDFGEFHIVNKKPGKALRILWAALYEGEYTADTLPVYQPKGYAHELMECMRYRQFFVAPINALPGIASYPYMLPVPMAAEPTLTVTGTVTGTTLSTYGKQCVSLNVTATKSGSGVVSAELSTGI